jgi:hypothetical protein
MHEELKCEMYTEDMKLACVYYKYKNKQLHPNKIPIKETMNECEILTDKEQYMCMLGLTEQLILQTGVNTERITEVCTSLDSLKNMCMETARINKAEIN